MSKTFRDNYYENDNLKKRKPKNNKQKRLKIKDKLRNIDLNNLTTEEELEELLDN